LPSSAVRTFTDPAEYGAAIRAGQIEVTTTGRGVFSGKIIRIDLHRLWMQRVSDNLPRVARVASSPARTIISFPSTPGPTHLWGGREIPWGTAYLIGNGQDIFERSSGSAETATMSLPVDDFASVVSTITHRDTKVQVDGLIVRPPASAIVKLQDIHAAAGGLAENAPAVLANAETARSLEQELVLAMVACMADVAEEDSLAVRHHQGIMRRFRALIEANVGNPLYLPEICAALGVSNRTLQRCCREQLGLSPLRYLWLRRMHMVRRALVASYPTPGAVTEIATRYGFWELGRFSVAYCSMFGERPSATLHRPPEATLKQ
jgi:AraC-like DNA-binding protein